MLYHVSEDRGIEYFAPRRSPNLAEPVVWAIDAEHLRNYLLPRNCPRVTFAAAANTTAADHVRFLGSARAVVAIEAAWFERAQQTPLACYHLPEASFRMLDAGAGYFVSEEVVTPVDMDIIPRPLDRLHELGVELRVLQNLWTLHDAVAASSLEFSMIRMAFATPNDAVEQLSDTF